MNIAIIFAGGTGTRMNSKIKPKQFLEMHGKPIIIHTLEKFEMHPQIDTIVISCIDGWQDYLSNLIKRYAISKVKKVVSGGKTGQLSIFNGLEAAEEIAGKERAMVLIHDGVRPFINEELISKNIESVNQKGSAITSVNVTETVVTANENGVIIDVQERRKSRLARAPQSFWLNDIIAVHRKAIEEGRVDFIDSCTMMHYYGKRMYLVEGSLENIKITTPEDFYVMRALLDAKENSQIYGMEK